MNKQNHVKYIASAIVIIFLTLLLCVSITMIAGGENRIVGNVQVVSASTSNNSTNANPIMLEPVEYTENGVIYEIQLETKSRGLAKIQYSISGKDGKITAKMYNAMALGTSTIEITLSLYAAPNNVDLGVLKAVNYTKDLNIFKSLKATASTGGVQQYWYGIAIVNLNGELQPPYVGYHILFDANGKRIS